MADQLSIASGIAQSMAQLDAVVRFSLQFSFQLFAVSFETDRLLTAEHREQGMSLEGKVFRQVCHVKPSGFVSEP